jgi:16S rRNA G966 N2-methylase RsmD
LDGGRAYWDHSANAVTFEKVNDRDFYVGRVVGDATSASTTCNVNFNIDPPYDMDNDALLTTMSLLLPRLSPDAVVAIERASRDPEPVWPAGYGVLAPKDYGETRIYWLDVAE